MIIDREQAILQAIQDVTGFCLEDIRSQSRKKEVVLARHLLVYFLSENTNMTLYNIASVVNRTDHSSIIHARKQIENYLDTKNKYVTEAINRIKELLKNVEKLIKIVEVKEYKYLNIAEM